MVEESLFQSTWPRGQSFQHLNPNQRGVEGRRLREKTRLTVEARPLSVRASKRAEEEGEEGEGDGDEDEVEKRG